MFLDVRALAQLLDDLLPALLRSVSCNDAALDLEQVRVHKRSRSQLLSALQEAADATLETSTIPGSTQASDAEQVSLLALHLMRCIELSDSPAGRRHLMRAVELGATLGCQLDSQAS